MAQTTSQERWPLRSLLFLPAHRRAWVVKTAGTAVDAVILDLEDAVPPAEKAAARSLIAEEIEILSSAGIAPIVRVNALAEGGEADVVESIRRGLVAIMLPKVDGPADIIALNRILAREEERAGLAAGEIGIVALPETAHGLWHAYDIAAASPRVTGLITTVSGPVSGDVSRAAGFEPSVEGHEQLFLQSRTILASRAAGAEHPIGTIMGTRIDDLVMVEALARRAKRLGFSGAALIHPTHVAIANDVFRPSEEEVAYSRGLLEAAEAAATGGAGAFTYRGMMVDAAMLPKARQVVSSADRFCRRDEAHRARPQGKEV